MSRLCSAWFIPLVLLSSTHALWKANHEIIAENYVACRGGSAVFDSNGDGFFEIFYAGCAGDANQHLVYSRVNRTFINTAPKELVGLGASAITAVGCDIDDDGGEEIYVMNGDMYGGNRSETVFDSVFKLTRTGKWVDLLDGVKYPKNAGVRNRWAGRSLACMYSRSAKQYAAVVPAATIPSDPFDLYSDPQTGKQNPAHQYGVKLFTMLKGEMKDLGETEGLHRMLSARGVTVGPIFTDSSTRTSPLDGSDLFIANDKGLNTLFLHDGDSHVSMEPSDLSDPYQNSRAVALADLDSDGLTDIILAAWDGSTQVLQQYMESGNPRFENVAGRTSMKDKMSVRNLVVADFDNDGWLEIFMALAPRRGTPAHNRLYKVYTRNDEEGDEVLGFREMETGDAAEPDKWTSGIVVGDFNRDGRLELLLTSGDSEDGQIRYLELSEPGKHHWLRVMPLSMSGAPARGADVTIVQGTVEEGQHIQRRIIDGGSGYGAQQEPVAHFGLGDDDRSPVEVTVRWPDGAISVDKIDIDTMVLFDHPGLEGEASETAPPLAQPPKPKPKPKDLPKTGGSAALLGAMMGKKAKPNLPPAPQPAAVGGGAETPAVRTEEPNGGAKPSGPAEDKLKKKKKKVLPKGLAKMLRRV